MIILMIGPSGSGKGTQAELLARKLDIPAISMGELLRQEIAAKSELGQKVEIYLAAGKWVPAELTWSVLRIELDKHPEGWVLDGFPRLVEQLMMLEEYLKLKAQRVDKIIYLKISDDEAVKRLLGRARHDDSEEIIRQRLKSFKETIEPILARVKQQGILEEVNGERPVEAIHQDIIARLNEQ